MNLPVMQTKVLFDVGDFVHLDAVELNKDGKRTKNHYAGVISQVTSNGRFVLHTSHSKVRLEEVACFNIDIKIKAGK